MVIASSSFLRIAPWVCICLGGLRGHPGDPTSWVPLGAALRASQGSPPLRGYVSKRLKAFLTPATLGDNAARFIHAECSVIKFRAGTVVLYPLAKHQPEVKPLHSKRVHAVIIAEE